MSYSIERFSHPQAIFVTIHSDFNFAEEASIYSHQLVEMLEKEPTPIYIIMDLSTFKLPLQELFSVTKELIQTDVKPYQHPNCLEVIVVTDATLWKASLDGFVSFGILKSVRAAATVEDALQMVASNQ